MVLGVGAILLTAWLPSFFGLGVLSPLAEVSRKGSWRNARWHSRRPAHGIVRTLSGSRNATHPGIRTGAQRGAGSEAAHPGRHIASTKIAVLAPGETIAVGDAPRPLVRSARGQRSGARSEAMAVDHRGDLQMLDSELLAAAQTADLKRGKAATIAELREAQIPSAGTVTVLPTTPPAAAAPVPSVTLLPTAMPVSVTVPVGSGIAPTYAPNAAVPNAAVPAAGTPDAAQAGNTGTLDDTKYSTTKMILLVLLMLSLAILGFFVVRRRALAQRDTAADTRQTLKNATASRRSQAHKRDYADGTSRPSAPSVGSRAYRQLRSSISVSGPGSVPVSPRSDAEKSGAERSGAERSGAESATPRSYQKGSHRHHKSNRGRSAAADDSDRAQATPTAPKPGSQPEGEFLRRAERNSRPAPSSLDEELTV